MKMNVNFRRYAVTIALSVLAAFTIDAAINFDECRQAFNRGRGKVETFSRSEQGLAIPAVIARISGTAYTLLFGR